MFVWSRQYSGILCLSNFFCLSFDSHNISYNCMKNISYMICFSPIHYERVSWGTFFLFSSRLLSLEKLEGFFVSQNGFSVDMHAFAVGIFEMLQNMFRFALHLFRRNGNVLFLGDGVQHQLQFRAFCRFLAPLVP